MNDHNEQKSTKNTQDIVKIKNIKVPSVTNNEFTKMIFISTV